VRYVLTAMPVAGVLWLLGALAITGAPPFGLFLSELTIMRAGLAGPNAWAVFVMLILLVVIFAGFLNHFRAMYFSETSGAEAPAGAWKRQPGTAFWCLLPMWLALLPILTLGLWWPGAMSHYFTVIASQLGGGLRP
jgi:hydrogenase-4 component F